MPLGSVSRQSRNSGKVVQRHSMPAAIAAGGMSSARSRLRMTMCLSAAAQGASVKPQLPMTTVVTPCQQDEVPVERRRVHDGGTLARIRAGMDDYAILVFRDQPFSDDEQLAFAQRLDGQLHARTGSAALGKSRLGNEALSDISNVDESGEL